MNVINRERFNVIFYRTLLKYVLINFNDRVIKKIVSNYKTKPIFNKSDNNELELNDENKKLIFLALAFNDAEIQMFTNAIKQITKDGIVEALGQMGYTSFNNVNNLLGAINPYAEKWAIKYSGQLIKNITQTTQKNVAKLLTEALKKGLTDLELAKNLKNSYTFSNARAEMIARTESAKADVYGNVMVYKDLGVEYKKWMIGSESCKDCLANEAQGAIPFNQLFISGDFAPPAHPNCTCDILPVKKENKK